MIWCLRVTRSMFHYQGIWEAVYEPGCISYVLSFPFVFYAFQWNYQALYQTIFLSLLMNCLLQVHIAIALLPRPIWGSVALSETLHGEIIDYRKHLVVARFPLYKLASVIQRQRTWEWDRKERTMEGGRREKWRRKRKDKRQWEKKERGKSIAVVLVLSQVKDLINMGAQSQHPPPPPHFPYGCPHLEHKLIDHCYRTYCTSTDNTQPHMHSKSH